MNASTNLYARVVNGRVQELRMPDARGRLIGEAPRGSDWYAIAWPVNPHDTGERMITRMLELGWPSVTLPTAPRSALVTARARVVANMAGPHVRVLEGEHADLHFRVLVEQRPLVRALQYGRAEPEVTVRFHPDDAFARIIGWQDGT